MRAARPTYLNLHGRVLPLYRNRWLLIFKTWTRKSEMIIECKRHIRRIGRVTWNFAENVKLNRAVIASLKGYYMQVYLWKLFLGV